jgi:hypothetical protein
MRESEFYINAKGELTEKIYQGNGRVMWQKINCIHDRDKMGIKFDFNPKYED